MLPIRNVTLHNLRDVSVDIPASVLTWSPASTRACSASTRKAPVRGGGGGPLLRIVDRGNTVVVIEHNIGVIEQADWIIDLGPEGGRNGGEIVFTGTPVALLGAEGSLTGEYLRRRHAHALT
jgi:hypothetical protein